MIEIKIIKDSRQKTCFLSQIIVLLIVAIFSFSSCKSVKSTNELDKNFNKKQIKDLNKINSFFIKECLNSQEDNFKTSFKALFEIKYKHGIDSLLNNVDYKKQKKLYKRISESTFNEIWEVRINTHEQFKGEEYITPKYKGKFQLYLKELSQTNKFASDCYKQMELSGDFYILHFDFYLMDNFDNIDFNDFNNQLVVSIYYLSMIDDNERDEKTKKRRLEYQKKVQSNIDSVR